MEKVNNEKKNVRLNQEIAGKEVRTENKTNRKGWKNRRENMW